MNIEDSTINLLPKVLDSLNDGGVISGTNFLDKDISPINSVRDDKGKAKIMNSGPSIDILINQTEPIVGINHDGSELADLSCQIQSGKLNTISSMDL